MPLLRSFPGNEAHKLFLGGGPKSGGLGGGQKVYVEKVYVLFSGVDKSARERIGRQDLSQKVPSKKGSLGVIFSPRNYRKTHTQNLQILREDTLGATCSAGPFCLLPIFLSLIPDCWAGDFSDLLLDFRPGGPERLL